MQRHASFRCQMRDDFVDVHIGLSAAAGLPDDQGKFIVPFSCTDFLTDGGDCIGLFLRQLSGGGVGKGAGFFQVRKGLDNLSRLALASYPEVLQAPLCLRSPLPFLRHRDFSHCVVFNAGFHCLLPLFFIWMQVIIILESAPKRKIKFHSLFRQPCKTRRPFFGISVSVFFGK